MKIKTLEKRLAKQTKINYGADGFAEIKEVSIYPDGQLIEVQGFYGVEADGMRTEKSFDLFFKDGNSAEFVAGMFNQKMLENDAEALGDEDISSILKN